MFRPVDFTSVVPPFSPPLSKNTSMHSLKVKTTSYLTKICATPCCSFDCVQKFSEENVGAHLAEWDIPAFQRRTKVFDLLRHSQVSSTEPRRPWVLTGGSRFDVRLRITTTSQTGQQEVFQAPVCFTALRRLTCVDASVFRFCAKKLKYDATALPFVFAAFSSFT